MFRYEKIASFAEQYGQSNDEQKENMERRSAKDLRQIYSSLGIKNRRSGSYWLSSEESEEQQGQQGKKVGNNQPFGMIVMRVNDVDKMIVPLSEQQLPEMIRKMLKGEKPELMSQFDQLTQNLGVFSQHIALTVGEKRSKIPTTSGLPLTLLRKTSGIGSVQGELKLRFESENLESSRGLTAEVFLQKF